MKFQARTHRQHAIMRLPLIALIDVVLFLLFYFILAANFTGQESSLSATISADRGGGRGSDLVPQVVRVATTAGRVRYQIGERVLDGRDALADVLRRLPQRGGVVVRCEGDVPVAAAAAALQACKDAGFVKVSYVPTR